LRRIRVAGKPGPLVVSAAPPERLARSVRNETGLSLGTVIHALPLLADQDAANYHLRFAAANASRRIWFAIPPKPYSQ
jgi:hypothetical protein